MLDWPGCIGTYIGVLRFFCVRWTMLLRALVSELCILLWLGVIEEYPDLPCLELSSWLNEVDICSVFKFVSNLLFYL